MRSARTVSTTRWTVERGECRFRPALQRTARSGPIGQYLARRAMSLLEKDDLSEDKVDRINRRKYAMTKKEIADELGTTEQAVNGLLVRAIEKIRLRHPELRHWL
jgi:DNA-binding CsgD family transcriptional regulator